MLSSPALSLFLQGQYLRQSRCPVVAQLGSCSSFPGWSVRTLRSIHTSSKEELLIYECSHKMVRPFKKKLHLLQGAFYRKEPQKCSQGMVMTNRAGWFPCWNSLYALLTSKWVEDNRITSYPLNSTKRQEKQPTVVGWNKKILRKLTSCLKKWGKTLFI